MNFPQLKLTEAHGLCIWYACEIIKKIRKSIPRKCVYKLFNLGHVEIAGKLDFYVKEFQYNLQYFRGKLKLQYIYA